MLHKNKSGKMMYAKFMFIVPILIAFVMTFNTKVIAQEKTVEKHEHNITMDVEIISKDFSKADLDALKASLLKQGITLSYKKLKYNDANEIISIALSVENKQGNKAQLQQSGTVAIKPISIKFDSEGALAVGNMEEMESHNVFIHEGGDKIHKTVIVNADGNVVTEEIHGPESENVWVSSSGDSTIVKTIKVIEIDEEHDGEKTVIVKKVHKKGENEEVIVVSGDEKQGEKKMMFISEGDEQPLMIVDGEEMEDGSMEDIDPESIATINVWKGEKAVEKYGEKAKNGVVIIETKK